MYTKNLDDMHYTVAANIRDAHNNTVIVNMKNDEISLLSDLLKMRPTIKMLSATLNAMRAFEDFSHQWEKSNNIIFNYLNLLDNTDEFTVIYRYSILGEDFEKIAEKMNYVLRRIYQIRKSAIDTIVSKISAEI